MPLLVRPLLFVAIVLGACGPEVADVGSTSDASDSGTSSTGTSTIADSSSDTTDATSSSTGPSIDTCPCVVPEEPGDTCNLVTACGLPEACPRLTVSCSEGSVAECGPDFGTELVFHLDALECVLSMLRDDTPARLLVDGVTETSAGQQEREILVLGDGTVAHSTCILQSHTFFEEGTAALSQSAGARYFGDCLTLDEPLARYDCIWGGLLDPVAPQACG